MKIALHDLDFWNRSDACLILFYDIIILIEMHE